MQNLKLRQWTAELRATWTLAVPLALAQVGHIAINTTDVLMIGRLGEESLAQAALGSGLYFAFMIFGVGVVSAVPALAAQAHGARQPRDVRRTVRQGFWVATAFCVPALIILAYSEEVLLLVRQPESAAIGAAVYVNVLMWSLPPTLWFIVLRGFVSALARPRPVMWIMFSGVLLNVILDFVFIFGHFGAPALGVVGAGYASVFVNLAMFGGLLWIALRFPPFRRYVIIARMWRPDWPRFFRIVRLGIPAGITLLLEVGLFIGAMFLMGLFGTTEIAAHQIAIQTAAVTFMVPLGISHAAVVRVGSAYGRGDSGAMARAAWVALSLSAAFMLAMAFLFWLLPRQIVGCTWISPTLPIWRSSRSRYLSFLSPPYSRSLTVRKSSVSPFCAPSTTPAHRWYSRRSGSGGLVSAQACFSAFAWNSARLAFGSAWRWVSPPYRP